MPALTLDINTTSWSSTIIGNNYVDGGYGFSASGGKAVSSGSFSILARQTPTNVQKVRVKAKPQNGLGIFCSSINYVADPDFSGVLFEIKVDSGKTFFRLSAKNKNISITKETAGSLISECPMPASMSTNTAYEFELTVGRFGWQVTYLKNNKRVVLLQLPILSESSIDGSKMQQYFKASNAVYCGVRTLTSGIEIDSLTIWYGGNQGNPYGGTLSLLEVTSSNGTIPTTATGWDPRDWTNKLLAKAGPLTGFTLGTTGLTLPTTKTEVITSLNNSSNDGITTDDIPVLIINFEVVSGEVILAFDHGGTVKNLYFNSNIDGNTSHAVSEETNGSSF